MADKKDIIEPRRIRKITNSFSWVDHRVITGGLLDDLSTIAIALYFFLMAVSDRHGVSFYRDDRICIILKIIARSLIAYKYPVYRVLALPEKLIKPPTAEELSQEKKKIDLHYLQKIRLVIGYRERSQLC